ncbi:hypothetical protein [Dentiradicibacter hellwigii]
MGWILQTSMMSDHSDWPLLRFVHADPAANKAYGLPEIPAHFAIHLWR